MFEFNNTKVKNGIGYKAFRKLRIDKEKIIPSKLEESDNKRYTLYFGRMHLEDFESNHEAIGPLKIGKTYFPTSLMRGRNEAGAQFRLYADIVFDDEDSMDECEKLVHSYLKEYAISGEEGQKELFNISDINLLSTVKSVIEMLLLPRSIFKEGFFIKEAFIYNDDECTEIEINVPKFELPSFIRFEK